MPVFGKDPALEREGIRTVPEHLQIVVGFDQSKVGAEQAAADLVGDAAHIRRHGEYRLALHAIPHALIGVMRRMKGHHAQRSEGEKLSHRDDAERILHRRKAAKQTVAHRVRRIDRNGSPLRQRFQSAYMIGVLMRDEHSVDITPCQTLPEQEVLDPARGNPGVDEYMGLVVREKQAVAGRSAGKNTQLHPT